VGYYGSIAHIYNYCKYIVKELIFYSLRHLVEERKFLYSLCSNALGMDESIMFTGVVNDYGKLILGLPRLFAYQKNGILGDVFFTSTPDSLYRILSHNNDGLYSIKNMKNLITHSNIGNRSDFQLINVAKDKYIAFTSLTEIHNKYLCIYFEAKESLNDIMLKLNTVFE
jgi:hypothetical protein